jgi:hypothetical protein
MQKQVPKEELPVVFEDVQILQAVQADADVPVTLSVLLDRSNRFQVSAAIGRSGRSLVVFPVNVITHVAP